MSKLNYLMFSCTRTALKVLGEKGLEGSSLSITEDDTVHYLVTDKKQKNFMKYCERIETARNPVETINLYTNHVTKYYSKVNLSLAADTNGLEEHSNFVAQLRASIFARPLFDNCRVFRGVDLSTKEIDQMEHLKHFYIPSFTSTSVEMDRAYKQPTLMVFDIPYASQYACSITKDLSPFYDEEREVLISCYSAFSLQRVEMDNGRKIISLYLDDHHSSLHSLQ